MMEILKDPNLICPCKMNGSGIFLKIFLKSVVFLREGVKSLIPLPGHMP